MMQFNKKPVAKPLKQLALLVAFALIVVWLMQGSFVQAETQKQARRDDRCIGFHVVTGQRNTDRSQWVEYGNTEIVASEFGTLQIPDLVLFGEYQEDTGEWIFPGMPGNNAFFTTCGAEEEGLSSGYKGMHADVALGFSSHLAEPRLHRQDGSDVILTSMVDDTRDSITLSGTIYLPATDHDVFVTFYRVYETKDERIYLDGSGNSSVDSGSGPGFGMGSTEEEVITVNGNEEYTITTDIHVDIEFVHPCTGIVLLEYNAQNECIASTNLAAETKELTLHSDTIWCVVQETDDTGAQRHTALSIADSFDGRALHHGFVTQSEDGYIHSQHLDLNLS